MDETKKLMADIAMLYYKKNCTQQQIADMFHLSRQTVSKLLNDAVKEKVVEIIIHDPESDCQELQDKICEKYKIKRAIVLSSVTDDDKYRNIIIIKGTINYLIPKLQSGNKKIGISWGRTIEKLADEFPETKTKGNIVFPLFGATDTDKACFSSNELARKFSEKLTSKVNYALFPYMPVSKNDSNFIKKTSCYKSMEALWKNIDIAIIGIGNRDILTLFNSIFDIKNDKTDVMGDIATHFFTIEGKFTPVYDNKLCASVDDIKNAKETIAIAGDKNKIRAIKGALKTGIIDTLITDEYTAKML